jgi:hypothetical protein
LTQAASPSSISCQGCKMNFTGVSVVSQTRDDHRTGPRREVVWPILQTINACRRSRKTITGDLPTSTRRSVRLRWIPVKHLFARYLWRLIIDWVL